MKETPVLMKGEMVRAILDGRKTQTRRVIKPQPEDVGAVKMIQLPDQLGDQIHYYFQSNSGKIGLFKPPFIKCPYGRKGDLLWVRETWKTCAIYDPYSPSQIDSGAAVLWVANGAKRLNGDENWGRTRSSIHMQKWACRLWLELTADPEPLRLQEITRWDIDSEGCPYRCESDDGIPKKQIVWFVDVWESINGPGSWASNSWVWKLEFKRVQK